MVYITSHDRGHYMFKEGNVDGVRLYSGRGAQMRAASGYTHTHTHPF